MLFSEKAKAQSKSAPALKNNSETNSIKHLLEIEMRLGDLVRVRFRTLTPHQRGGPPEWEEWWEEGAIVAEEYHTWEKIVSVLHKGEILRKEANDVQLISRGREGTKNR
jgi:hypothetical protein